MHPMILYLHITAALLKTFSSVTEGDLCRLLWTHCECLELKLYSNLIYQNVEIHQNHFVGVSYC